MNHNYEKLKTLLKELFQLDQPDLDFGLYRIMHAKNKEVSQFLDEDLLPQVEEAFNQHRTADRSELDKELNKVIAGVEAAGMDPEESPKVKELLARIKNEACDISALENEVYDHLFNFFRRYYSEGDFLAKRVYKSGVYAVPYQGEEVLLHWANMDQYYIKTSEYLRDYSFCLHPDSHKEPLRVHFRLVDVTEEEHGNIKAAEEKNRRFILVASGRSPNDFLALESKDLGDELVIYFEYRIATPADWPEEERASRARPPTQKDLNTLAAKRILSITDPGWVNWINELSKIHIMANGESADYSRLEAHLNRYTARNTFDYFIHKNLGDFLQQELDFYIKNEVMHLDDVENESAPRVEQYLSTIKVIRKIACKIIDFLAQLENFQRKLWTKKKFIVETHYCLTIGSIPEEFWAEIVSNQAQQDEWMQLYGIDQIRLEAIKRYPTLVVDTRHFDMNFVAQLLWTIGNLEEQTGGVVLHSDNFQALSMMKARYRNKLDCVCIDPPYNTGSDGFCYKDNYKDSSWLSQQHQTLSILKECLKDTGSLFTCCDENQAHSYVPLLRQVYGAQNLVETIIWNKRVPKNDKGIGNIHDFIFLICSDLLKRRSLNLSYNMKKDDLEDIYKFVERCRSQNRSLEGTQQELKKFYDKQGYDRGITLYCELDPEFKIWGKINMSWPNPKTEGPRYEVINPVTGKPVPIPKNGWRWKEETFRESEGCGPTYYLPDGSMMKGRIWYAASEAIQPSSITYLDDVQTFLLRSILSVKSGGSAELENMGLSRMIDYPKPVSLIKRLLFSTGDTEGTVLDYFAGSGTTGDAVINLNREDGGRRKFLLVEMGDYFETVLLPRLKKVTFAPEWKNGKPERSPTPKEFERSPHIIKVVRLESYEDTLNNLDVSRTDKQQQLLDSSEAKGAESLREQYVLRYMLDVETRGSQSLLNTQAFTDPTAYKLKVKQPSSNESCDVNVDLLETFNWLIGLIVHRITAPQTFNGFFEHDSEGRLRLKGDIRQEEDGPYWFRAVTGILPNGNKTLVIWRKLNGNVERDNLMLNEWFSKSEYSGEESEFDLIYTNGSNNLENLKAPNALWKVRLIEEDFHHLMFDTEEV